ncbi:MAG TPA: O-antigen ligase family protein [Candidatus Limnocylindrales bacterium]|nr:O-antigen ligase family protein [Candidatus Limnocylindrales bacterium]
MPWAVLLALALAVAIGVAVPVSPLAGLAFGVVVAGLLVVVGLGHRFVTVFKVALALLLVGYAFFGRGLAHVGVPPLYLSEMVLGMAVVAFAFSLARARFGPLHGLLIVFMVWGLARTLPYAGTYGLDAFRDAVTWAYGFFALTVSITVGREDFAVIARWFRRLAPLFLIWVPISAILVYRFGAVLPTAPGSDVPLIFFKGGDMGVHLAGVGAFVLLGLYGLYGSGHSISELRIWATWLVALAVAGAVNRGGLLAASMATTTSLFVRSSARWFSLLFVALLLAAAAGLINPTVDVGARRTISVEQLASNVFSVLSDNGTEGLQGTKDWRLAWWTDIVNYTFNGPFFWDGKGYGINLADADGFQVSADHSLRAPHNSHIEILARSGVPGFALWVLFQGAFAIALVMAAFRARGAGLPIWTRLMGWLFAYWLAIIVNSSFDPYLEGPQGGIWFWTIVGLGLAAIRLSREGGDVSIAPPPEPRAT